MIKRQYIVDYDAVVNGKTTKWGTISFQLTSWFPKFAGDFADYVRSEAADFHKVEPTQIRIRGVFKV